jgi:glutathione peroxidase
MLRSWWLTPAVLAVCISPLFAEEAKDVPEALNFSMKSLGGEDVELSKYEGQVLLVVNVASECGLTPQYKELQALHEKYHDQGLAVLGFPCNQFGSQEPGDAQEIRQFCTKNYGVKFDLFSKIEVNGEKAAPLYKYLTQLELQPKGPGKVSWNFEKFLINRKGEVVARFDPQTKPNAAELVKQIEELLAAK